MGNPIGKLGCFVDPDWLNVQDGVSHKVSSAVERGKRSVVLLVTPGLST